jgi:hypothetical protein
MATPGHVCPGIRIHIIDKFQPPGIGMPFMADIESHNEIVSVALATNNSAAIPKKFRCEVRANAISKSFVTQFFGYSS